ncbi:MAG: anaerobic ribonucleoside-triphosphate reductase activating protein [Desulfotomaculales bacterium]
MIIGGFTKLSTIDWPGKLAAVIFTKGCNFRCPWCHNKGLVWPELYGPEIPEREALVYLEKRKSYLDGVVVTGGEPTIHKDLPAFLRKIRNIGLKTKLDTNGSSPDILEYLLQQGLLDALAVDVKAPLEKYPEVTGVPVDTEALWRSFSLAASSGLPVWFRTTLAPGLGKEDIEQIIEQIKKLIGQSSTNKIVHVFQEYREGR